ncbi:hypothetical protein JCM19239_4267 [Vibrio variabilis]|uniref:Uncharacterized protein n=1 Tax=Vibrio variabilis TaxID=990271 RepID=A0ABQ0JAI4_9VIBR|nr:hypothetical protein JCM19239_4267 [Vibrio variabilis]
MNPYYNRQTTLLSTLSQEELSALVALYSVSTQFGQGAYLVNSDIGIWLSDLSFQVTLPDNNGLGFYTIEKEVLSSLIDKNVIQEKNTIFSRCLQKIYAYQIAPKLKEKIGLWLIENEISLPVLIDFNLSASLKS